MLDDEIMKNIEVLEVNKEGRINKIRITDAIFVVREDCPIDLDPIKVTVDFLRVYDVSKTIALRRDIPVQEESHIVVYNNIVIDDGDYNVIVGKENVTAIYLDTLVKMHKVLSEKPSFVTTDVRVCFGVTRSDDHSMDSTIRGYIRFLRAIGCVEVLGSMKSNTNVKLNKFVASPLYKLNIDEEEAQKEAMVQIESIIPQWLIEKEKAAKREYKPLTYDYYGSKIVECCKELGTAVSLAGILKCIDLPWHKRQLVKNWCIKLASEGYLGVEPVNGHMCYYGRNVDYTVLAEKSIASVENNIIQPVVEEDVVEKPAVEKPVVITQSDKLKIYALKFRGVMPELTEDVYKTIVLGLYGKFVDKTFNSKDISIYLKSNGYYNKEDLVNKLIRYMKNENGFIQLKSPLGATQLVYNFIREPYTSTEIHVDFDQEFLLKQREMELDASRKR